MNMAKQALIYRQDYTPSDFHITDTHLHFDLTEDFTDVSSTLRFSKNNNHNNPLILNGRELELLDITLNNQNIKNKITINHNTHTLSIPIPDDLQEFTLAIKTRIYPQNNTSLEGLYKVKNLFCTQCESEGFRKITYYLDRPDVMAKFTTSITADRQKYPVLLSNGNLIQDEGNTVTWHDPFKKPCYLFALVAGDLACVEDSFITRSHRNITIKLYIDKGDEDKTAFALQSIKRAMKWDEDNFGREYDLDIFMVVATHDFNFGAMENKGLNIFNSKYILAKPQTATDDDYKAIERVIGHEYFHNWTGNRITCRDWFQLSLKESLTVFRDSLFSADQNSAAVVRINDVNTLKTIQFAQDASPMAHPVRPDSYMEINNFYTVTIYEKGAEVIRMLYTLLGKSGFRAGMDYYFNHYDGQAVTIDDFVHSHAMANHKDLSAFMAWYERAGTPELAMSSDYNAQTKQFILHIKQNGPVFYMPFKMGLLNLSTGTEILAQTLEIKNPDELFVFDNIPEKPLPSLLRDFSAPIKFTYDYSPEDLAFLVQHDTDAVAQWDAGQELSKFIILNYTNNKNINLLLVSWKTVLDNKTLDPDFKALLLTLPSENYLLDAINSQNINLDNLILSRKAIRNTLAHELNTLFLTEYNAAASRALKNKALLYLGILDTENYQSLILKQLYTAQNMTDEIAALSAISHSVSPLREKALQDFYLKWQHEPLVLDKWFAIQARSELPNALSRVKALLDHPAMDIKNPNKIRALIGGFCQNTEQFHAKDGSGYDFLKTIIIKLNTINPKVAARLIEPFTQFKKYDAHRQDQIKAELALIKNTPKLSVDLYEIITKTIGA